MEEPPRVLAARPEQAAAVTGLLVRFFAEEGFAVPAATIGERVAAFLTEPANAVFLAWRGGRAVGVATVTTRFGIEYGLGGELEDLYVLPGARGAGVAGRLIDAAAGWCRSRGGTQLEVCVTPEGQRAHDLVGFYRRRGFADQGRRLLNRPLG
ncbi:MAG TPA: GNAT family N-acetyltransferase [Actinomycetes bacterium]|nr:GNAT family N-acetyltransferase [Actinomycetes bacterium]